jgi:hypothetical protein
MLAKLAQAILDLEKVLPEGSMAHEKCAVIKGGLDPELSTATDVVVTVTNARKAIKGVLEKNTTVISENDIDDLVVSNSSILAKLFTVRTRQEKKKDWSPSDKKCVLSSLRHIYAMLGKLLDSDTFSRTKVEAAQSGARQAQEDLRAAKGRLEKQLTLCPRVRLLTIGSSHKLPVLAALDDDNSDGDEEDLVISFGRLKLARGEYQARKTIVVFDEAGCIPDYELLGLSRLGRNIKGIMCVGDKHQLPPYDPNSMRTPVVFRNGMKGSRLEGKRNAVSEKVKSLLDASRLTVDDDSRIKLTSQYRVPRDIANLLDARIYRGDYKTDPKCKAPLKGFHFVHVPAHENGRKKYVNENEIQYCVELVRKSLRDGFDSIMVLTPVSPRLRRLIDKNS